MHVRIVCPEHSAYEGDAAFIALPTTDGELGVLPRHANEICTVEPGYVRVCDQQMGEVSRTFAIDGGYVEITGDTVIVLAERAESMADVDRGEVQLKLQGFEEQLSNTPEGDAHRAFLYNEIAWCKLLLQQ